MSSSSTRQQGFSIIEFMIAITLSLLVLAALSAAFVANSRSRVEIERANEQMENGRFALQLLTDDLELSGYLSHMHVLNVQSSFGVIALPNDPCERTSIANLNADLLVHIQGYDSLAAADPGVPTCIEDFKGGTDIIVIRRAATCVAGTANCAWVPNAPYLQASLCSDQLNPIGNPVPQNNWYQLAVYTGTASGPGSPTTQPAAAALPGGSFSRLKRTCQANAPAEARQFLTHVYYVATTDVACDTAADCKDLGVEGKNCDADPAIDGDCIPTLKRAELGAGPAFSIISLAHGVENLQVEYGVDALPAAPGFPDGAPETFTSAPADVTAWRNVVSVRLHLLARTTQPSRDHTDTKTYTLGDVDLPAFNDGYKRHVYQTSVRLNNPAGRRER